MFSTYVLQRIATRKKGVDTREELAPLAQTNMESSLQKKDPIRLASAPATCTVAVQRPSDGAAAARKLNEDTFLNGENANYGAVFANNISVDCL